MLVAEIPLHRPATLGSFLRWMDDGCGLRFHSVHCRRDRRRPLAAFPGLWRFDSIRFVVFARGRNNRIWRWGNNLCVGLAHRPGIRRNLCCRCGCACGEFGRGGGVEGRGSCQGVWGGPLGTGPLDPGFRREDGGGERTGKGCWWRRAPFVCPQQLLWMARGWGFQGVWWRTMALRMVRSLCMQATSATFLGLPWATSRS